MSDERMTQCMYADLLEDGIWRYGRVERMLYR